MSSLKSKLVAEIILSLEKDLALLQAAALEAREAATHEESKAEDKYDTRGLEASYLAGAQAKRAAELEELIFFYRHLKLPELRGAAIGATALVELESGGQRSHYFIVPKGGGKRFKIEDQDILVITPVSPLGAELLGRTVNESFTVLSPKGQSEYEIVNFS